MGIITGRGKRAITDHFDISYELEHQIEGTSKEKMLADIRDIIDNCTFTRPLHNLKDLSYLKFLYFLKIFS